MAAAYILHVGDDLCHRISVMKHAGLFVIRADCSMAAIKSALAQNQSVSAITFHNDLFPTPQGIVPATRELSAAPLVLFENPSVICEERLFDLVIASHTPPSVWLQFLHDATIQSQDLRQVSQQLRAESRSVRFESKRLRSESARIVGDPFDTEKIWNPDADKS